MLYYLRNHDGDGMKLQWRRQKGGCVAQMHLGPRRTLIVGGSYILYEHTK